MSADVIHVIFDKLFTDIDDPRPEDIPLLSHYTSYSVLESILRDEQLWLSNPLYMTDIQEVRFGINESYKSVTSSLEIDRSFGDNSKYRDFRHYFDNAYSDFANKHVLDIYVFCFSTHMESDTDGRLSMWRGYGSNASGACIVLNPKKIPQVTDTPFIFSKVTYASHSEQYAWMNAILKVFCSAVEEARGLEGVAFYAAHYLFERIKIFSLFTKHKGFEEENEWRLAYLLERDKSKEFVHMLDYRLSERGPEPKLKLSLRDVPGFAKDTFTLSNIVDRIILGPANSHPLGRAAFLKILEKHGQHLLKNRVFGSTIPYRSQGVTY